MLYICSSICATIYLFFNEIMTYCMFILFYRNYLFHYSGTQF